MSKLGDSVQSAVDLIEVLSVLGREMHWFSAFARGSQVVQRDSQRSLFVNYVFVEIYKAEERL